MESREGEDGGGWDELGWMRMLKGRKEGRKDGEDGVEIWRAMGDCK